VLIDDLKDKSFRMYYRLKRGGDIIALAETGIAPFIYGGKRPVSVPDAFIDSLKSFRKQSGQ